MLRLFGSPRRALDAYDEVDPLAAGHEERVALWQLLPLLVHAVAVRRRLRRVARRGRRAGCAGR